MRAGHWAVVVLFMMSMSMMLGCQAPAARIAEVCSQLTAAGVARDCTLEDERAPLSMRFTLLGPGSHGYVYMYETDQAFERALQESEEIDALFDKHGQRPHRYDNRAKRISVMLVHAAEVDAQRISRQVVDGL